MAYFKSRDNKLKFRLPRVLEAAVILTLAERYRIEEEHEKAKEFVSLALENYPESKSLREYEATYPNQRLAPIEWGQILLSKEKEIESTDTNA